MLFILNKPKDLITMFLSAASSGTSGGIPAVTSNQGHRERKVWNINTPKEKQDLQYSTFWTILATAVVAQPIHEQKADGRLSELHRTGLILKHSNDFGV